MSIVTLLREVEDEILKWRRIKRILESADDIDLMQAKVCIQSGDEDGLRDLVHREPDDLSQMPIRKLRKIASTLNIQHYHLLPKPSILSEIARVQEKSAKKGIICASK